MVRLSAILNWNGFHNIPKKFIERRMFKGVVYENTHMMAPSVVYNYTKDWIYDENAPWTTAAETTNDPTQRNRRNSMIKFVPQLPEWHFFRGDRVEILRGRDAGKQGLVNGIIRQRNWVLVEGLNCKLSGYSMSKDQGDLAFQMKEKPLVVLRDVKLVDPSDFKPTDVVFRYTVEGERVRVSKRTGQIIPIPADAESTVDYVKKSTYKPGPKDTETENATKDTFFAEYKTFEQDLMDQYGIKEEGERAPTFVY